MVMMVWGDLVRETESGGGGVVAIFSLLSRRLLVVWCCGLPLRGWVSVGACRVAIRLAFAFVFWFGEVRYM